MKSAWWKGGAIALAFVIGYGSFLITKKSDAPLEQAAEAVLRAHGIEIDISPEP